MLGENTHFKIKVINLIAIVAVIYIYNLNLSLWETTETLKFQETRADMAVGVIDAMLETQSSEVDAVSGATFSSNGIKAAVAEALQEAEGE